MSDHNVQRLRRLDACAVSDALDKLQLPGVVTGLPQRSGAGRIAGRAVTMKVGPGQPPPGPAARGRTMPGACRVSDTSMNSGRWARRSIPRVLSSTGRVMPLSLFEAQLAATLDQEPGSTSDAERVAM